MGKNNDNIPKEQLLEDLDSSFSKVALQDIERSLAENTNLSVFILGVCLIDALAGFRFGKETKYDGQDGPRFKKFVKIYLKEYNANDLWDIRNGLLHSYVVKGYNFVNKKRYLHNPTKQGEKIINDENFYDDIETAYQVFRRHILDDKNQGKILENVKKRLPLGLMKIMPYALARENKNHEKR